MSRDLISLLDDVQPFMIQLFRMLPQADRESLIAVYRCVRHSWAWVEVAGLRYKICTCERGRCFPACVSAKQGHFTAVCIGSSVKYIYVTMCDGCGLNSTPYVSLRPNSLGFRSIPMLKRGFNTVNLEANVLHQSDNDYRLCKVCFNRAESARAPTVTTPCTPVRMNHGWLKKYSFMAITRDKGENQLTVLCPYDFTTLQYKMGKHEYELAQSMMAISINQSSPDDEVAYTLFKRVQHEMPRGGSRVCCLCREKHRWVADFQLDEHIWMFGLVCDVQIIGGAFNEHPGWKVMLHSGSPFTVGRWLQSARAKFPKVSYKYLDSELPEGSFAWSLNRPSIQGVGTLCQTKFCGDHSFGAQECVRSFAAGHSSGNVVHDSYETRLLRVSDIDAGDASTRSDYRSSDIY